MTGGAGYIGSHVCKALAKAGHQPVAYDNLSRGFKQAVHWGPLVEGDIRDVEKLQKSFADHKIEAIIHLAAFAYVAESVVKPRMYFENNVDGTALLLEAMTMNSIKKLVFSSSCAVYGESKVKFINENHPTSPINPYGLSKLMGEKMVKQWLSSPDSNRGCCLRYFNAAGADLDGEIGENHNPEPHLIPTLLKKADQGSPLTLFGQDYPTEDGTCVRDFIHVSDLAQAHVLVLERMLESKKLKPVYNLGIGKGYSLKEVAKAILKVTQNQNPITYGERREGDPAYLVGDTQLFATEFNWKPQIQSLEKMIESGWSWMKKINS